MVSLIVTLGGWETSTRVFCAGYLRWGGDLRFTIHDSCFSLPSIFLHDASQKPTKVQAMNRKKEQENTHSFCALNATTPRPAAATSAGCPAFSFRTISRISLTAALLASSCASTAFSRSMSWVFLPLLGVFVFLVEGEGACLALFWCCCGVKGACLEEGVGANVGVDGL